MGSSLVRTAAFARGELVSTLRQPRLLLVLILGPFLVLFLFGLGYRAELPSLATIVVGAEGDVTDQVDRYLRDEQPAGLDYVGTRDDREDALRQLRAGEVDLVVVLPEQPLAELEAGERAEIGIHHRTLDPVTFSQIEVAADTAVSRINDEVLEQVLRAAQDRSGDYATQLDEARSQLDAVRAAVDRADVAAVQRTAGTLGQRLDGVADTLASGGTIAGGIGLGRGLEALVDDVRTAAQQLRQLADLDAVGELDEAASTLAEVDQVVGQLQAVDPAVAVRPFRPEVVSATPVPITLQRFFAPGLLALMLQHLGVTFAALALVRERRTDTTELLQVSPATTGERLAGKTVAFLLLGSLAGAILFALVVLVFGVPLPSAWGAFVVLLVLTLLASIGIGSLVAALSRTDSQAVQLSMLLFLTAIFFSGLFMPFDRIEWPVLAVSWLLPATHAFVGMQEVLLLGSGVPWSLLIAPTVIALVTFALARLLVPRREGAS